MNIEQQVEKLATSLWSIYQLKSQIFPKRLVGDKTRQVLNSEENEFSYLNPPVCYKPDF